MILIIEEEITTEKVGQVINKILLLVEIDRHTNHTISTTKITIEEISIFQIMMIDKVVAIIIISVVMIIEEVVAIGNNRIQEQPFLEGVEAEGRNGGVQIIKPFILEKIVRIIMRRVK